MGYTNSPLVAYTKLSPNHSGQRTHSIDRITPHCVVGQLSAERICDCFPAGRNASCNYGIGVDGKVSLCVEEKNRSWCSSSSANDQRAITIECASDKTHPYAMNDKVYASLINLCVDICKRNGKKKLLWFANKDKSLSYEPKADEMVITVHRWFANKSCPGDWLYNRLGELAAEVTKRLGGVEEKKPVKYRVQVGAYSEKKNAEDLVKKLKDAGFNGFIVEVGGETAAPVTPVTPTPPVFKPYKVRVTDSALNIRSGAGTDNKVVGCIRDKGTYTIVEEADGKGADKWGKLKSGAGWISLDFTKRV